MTLDPNHMDDTGLLDGLLPCEMLDSPYGDNFWTSAQVTATGSGFVLTVDSGSGFAHRAERASVPLSRNGMRELRRIIDAALGDRT